MIYAGQKYFVPEGANIHLSTFAALVDPYEWGENSTQFDPVGNKPNHSDLHAKLTFGYKGRHCKGEVLSTIVSKGNGKAIIKYCGVDILSW